MRSFCGGFNLTHILRFFLLQFLVEVSIRQIAAFCLERVGSRPLFKADNPRGSYTVSKKDNCNEKQSNQYRLRKNHPLCTEGQVQCPSVVGEMEELVPD